MTIDLLKALSSFEAVGDQESEIAFFRTHVPWVAPEAYLHIVYKAAPRVVLSALAQGLRMPSTLIEFLAKQNGARLFSGSLSIFGVLRPGQLLNRRDVLCLLPFDIERENSEMREADRDRFLAVGGYGFDGSTVCIERRSGRMGLFPREGRSAVAWWTDLNDWITSEIIRLSGLFDKRGKRLVEESETVPPQAHGWEMQFELDSGGSVPWNACVYDATKNGTVRRALIVLERRKQPLGNEG